MSRRVCRLSGRGGNAISTGRKLRVRLPEPKARAVVMGSTYGGASVLAALMASVVTWVMWALKGRTRWRVGREKEGRSLNVEERVGMVCGPFWLGGGG